MRATFTHLTQEERCHIYIEHKKKVSAGQIAQDLGRDKSTITRDLERNTGSRGYRHQQAHIKAQRRHADKPKAIKLDEAMKQAIIPLIKEKWIVPANQCRW